MKRLPPHPATVIQAKAPHRARAASATARPAHAAKVCQRMDDARDWAAILAERAMKLVLGCHGDFLPVRFKTESVADVFKFYGEGDYTDFEAAYAACVADMSKAVGKLLDPAEVAPTLFGFVPPSPVGRKVHVQRSTLTREIDVIGALAHEYIHYLSHPNFMPKLFQEDPPQGFYKVEGVTDVLMLMACSAPETGLNVQQLIGDWVEKETAGISEESARLATLHCATKYFTEDLKWAPLGSDSSRLIGYPKEYEAAVGWVSRQYPASRRAVAGVDGPHVTPRVRAARASYRERHPDRDDAFFDQHARKKLQAYAFCGRPCNLDDIHLLSGSFL